MKKIFFAAMTLVMAVFASCSNDDAPLEGIGDFKVNFTVADKAGFDGDTRAVKTGWENGDQILIALDNGEEVWYTETVPFNYIKLTYNGTTWTTDEDNLNKSRLGDSGHLTAIYHPGIITFGDYNSHAATYMLSGYKGGEYLNYLDYYTYDSSTETLDLGTIALVRYSQDFQISIKDLASAGEADGTWELYIQDAEGNKAQGMSFKAAGKAFLRDTGFATYDTDYSTGINYGGDVVFYFSNAGSNETSLKFELTDGTDTYTYTTTKIPEMGKAYTLPALSSWTEVTE